MLYNAVKNKFLSFVLSYLSIIRLLYYISDPLCEDKCNNMVPKTVKSISNDMPLLKRQYKIQMCTA